jgi:hypothetical protein
MRLFTFLTICLVWSHNIWASIGSVDEIKGKGSITRTDGVKIEIEQSLEVFSYDEVTTGKGRTAINFVDDTRVEITEHSKLIIDEFVYDPANNEGGFTLTAALGTVRYASGQIAKDNKENIKIQTPTATIGVRGTDFAMIVDELGGSTIILLPSCNTNGNCVVGEIAVDSAVGQVILNQAFQATRVDVPESPPVNPLLLDFDESFLSNLLIVSPPREFDDLEDEASVQTMADILGLDFLEIDVLDKDLLAEDQEQWQTELDIDFLAGDFLGDVLAQLNKILQAEFLSELGDVFVKKEQKVGQLPGGVILLDQGSNWFFRREGSSSVVQLRLSKQYDYVIDLKQDDFVTRDFLIGDGGGNSINISQ